MLLWFADYFHNGRNANLQTLVKKICECTYMLNISRYMYIYIMDIFTFSLSFIHLDEELMA